MTVCIVTFANIGKKKNLKTPDIEPILSAFAAIGELKQVICQIDEGSSYTQVSSAIPPLLRYSLRAFEKISGRSFSRKTMERLFDFFAAQSLKAADITILHGGYFLKKTELRARAYGSIIIDLAVSAHLSTNAALEREELPQLGFPEYEGLYMRLEREAAQSNTPEYVIALSEFVKRSYIQHGFPSEKVFVALPDIDTQRFSPGENAINSFRVLYIAHTQPLKGLQYLLDAWKAFTPTDATLTIIGGFSDMPDELKKRYLSSIQSDSRITWIPGASEPEKYYRNSSVLVFPSLTEGFGRVTLEAIACGIPVVTTENARGIVEDGKTGFIVPIRNASALREKIEFMYHNPMKRKEMGKAAREAVLAKEAFGPSVLNICHEIQL